MMQRDCIDTSDYTACDMALQYCDDPVWGYAALNAGVNR